MESDKLIRPYKYPARYTTSETMLILSAAVILLSFPGKIVHHTSSSTTSTLIAWEKFVGLTLLGLTIWSFTWKLTAYRYFMDLKMDTTFLTLPGGLLTIPCFFLTVLVLKRNQLKPLILTFVIKVVAVTMLFTSYHLGTDYQLHYANETTRLRHTIPTQPLNYTLHSIIASYEESPENTTNLHKLQQTFSCCGSDGSGDFLEIPTSCCSNYDCETNGYYIRGCRPTIQSNVAWHNNIMLSVIQLFILVFFFNGSMVITVYISDHYRWKAFERSRMKQSG